MNQNVSSLFAVALAFFAFTASANTVTTATDVDVQMELTDAVNGAITMNALVLLPDGTTSRKSATYRTMQEAVDGYVKFVTTLPYGSRLIRVEFTDQGGNVVFASQG